MATTSPFFSRFTQSPFAWFFRAPSRRGFFLVRATEYAILVCMVFTLAVVIVNFNLGMGLALTLLGSGQMVQASSVGIEAINPSAIDPSTGSSLASAVAGPASVMAIAQLREVFDAVMGAMLVLLSAWTVAKSRNDGAQVRDKSRMLLRAVARHPHGPGAGSLLLTEVTALLWGTSAVAGVLLSLLVVLPTMQATADPTLFAFMFQQIPEQAWELLALVVGLSVLASWRRIL
ncbi:MAG: hypothetical protein JRN54_02355 [Nitrososphaerota archaeon]|jgi:hypothetical protein|nr:hypothetical protein [Nitrososphaerota archaeon]MDG7016024.1 hypothetical protein [Nitrososphaerota archaeon]